MHKDPLHKIFDLLDSFIDCPDAEAHLVCGDKYLEVANLFNAWANGKYHVSSYPEDCAVFGNADDPEVAIFFWKTPPTHNAYYKQQIIDISNHWMLE